jgi:predicted RNA-binding Zn-ribbon protein involved in translation (DUF1610 family)
MERWDNVRRVFSALKHRKPSPIFCPRCASPKINLSSSFDAWLTPKRYLCQNCGYLGPIVMELEKEEKENGDA